MANITYRNLDKYDKAEFEKEIKRREIAMEEKIVNEAIAENKRRNKWKDAF